MLTLLASLALAQAAAPAQLLGKRVLVYTTADSTNLRLTPADTLVFKEAEPITEAQVYVFVDPRRTFQTMIGIGQRAADADHRLERAPRIDEHVHLRQDELM